MQAVQIVLVCIAAAMICSAIRMQRPEMATGVSLAAGVCVLLILCREMDKVSRLIGYIRSLAVIDGVLFGSVLKAAGIAIISEMGAQICTDAGEQALAGRIVMASRISMVWLSLPMFERMLQYLGFAA